jgi:hypothetical protein
MNNDSIRKWFQDPSCRLEDVHVKIHGMMYRSFTRFAALPALLSLIVEKIGRTTHGAVFFMSLSNSSVPHSPPFKPFGSELRGAGPSVAEKQMKRCASVGNAGPGFRRSGWKQAQPNHQRGIPRRLHSMLPSLRGRPGSKIAARALAWPARGRQYLSGRQNGRGAGRQNE